MIDVAHPSEMRRLDVFVTARQQAESHACLCVEIRPLGVDRPSRGVTDVENLCVMTHAAESRREERRGRAETAPL